MREYQVCNRCVMDTTDVDIKFDVDGVCNHCSEYFEHSKIFPQDAASKKAKLDELVRGIKAEGQGKRYDCIIGLSGGVDSTYVAYLVKSLGLRPLAVHFDNSWNSELAVKNMEHVLKKLGIDLHTHVMDWDEFRDLQLAFLKASVRDAEAPTDHAIVAVLLRQCEEQGVRYILSGNNHATEGILPLSYSYGSFDWRYIKSVHRKYGATKLKTYPHFGFSKRLQYSLVKHFRNVGILNFVDYDKPKAMELLKDKLGWVYYGGKHYESIYTRWFQGHYLPVKFGIDKRRAHLSALVCAGTTSRDEALAELKTPAYPTKEMLREDIEYVQKKFGLSQAQYDQIIASPNRYFLDYGTYYPMLKATKGLAQFAKRLGLLPKRVGI